MNEFTLLFPEEMDQPADNAASALEARAEQAVLPLTETELVVGSFAIAAAIAAGVILVARRDYRKSKQARQASKPSKQIIFVHLIDRGESDTV